VTLDHDARRRQGDALMTSCDWKLFPKLQQDREFQRAPWDKMCK